MAKPAQVTGLRAVEGEDGQLTLSWNEVKSDIKPGVIYSVYMRTETSNFKLLNRNLVFKPTYTHKGFS